MSTAPLFEILPDGTIRTNSLELALEISARLTRVASGNHGTAEDSNPADSWSSSPSASASRKATKNLLSKSAAKATGHDEVRANLLKALEYVADSERAYSSDIVQHVGLKNYQSLSVFPRTAGAIFEDIELDWSDIILGGRDSQGSFWRKGPRFSAALKFLRATQRSLVESDPASNLHEAVNSGIKVLGTSIPMFGATGIMTSSGMTKLGGINSAFGKGGTP